MKHTSVSLTGGTSLCTTIPKALAKELDIEAGSLLLWEREGDRLTLRKA